MGLSAEMYKAMVEVPCEPCLMIDDDYEWGDNYLDSPFKPNCQTLFNLTLKMNEEGAYYSTSPELFSVSCKRNI